MKIKTGDLVKVISGNDKGKTGRVIRVIPKKNRIIAEGIKIVKKHVRPSQDNPQGGIVEKELSIHISNVMFLSNSKPTKVSYKINEDGSKVRFSRKLNKVL